MNLTYIQGDVLAQFLFIIVIDYVMNVSQEQNEFGFIFASRPSSRKPERKINDLDYADDIALLENSIAMTNQQLSAISRSAALVGLEINVKKTEYMSFNISHDSIDDFN